MTQIPDSAMILAAGLGTRMRPLTANCPKPALPIRGQRLVSRHIERLQRCGVRHIVINASYLSETLRLLASQHKTPTCRISFSCEAPTPLETAGGIARAAANLGDEFILVNGDIWTDFDFTSLNPLNEAQAHLVLVGNPVHHPGGDFALNGRYVEQKGKNVTLTYAGIARFKRSCITQFVSTQPNMQKIIKLRNILDDLIIQRLLTGQYYGKTWCDIGTPTAALSMCN